MTQESGARLRERVKELLGESVEPSLIQTETLAMQKADALLETEPLDSTHLFYEELRRIGGALREVAPEDLTEADLNKLMPVLDQLSIVLFQIGKRKQQQRQELKKLQL